MFIILLYILQTCMNKLLQYFSYLGLDNKLPIEVFPYFKAMKVRPLSYYLLLITVFYYFKH